MENPLSKFTLKQWISHPTTILLIAVTFIAWGVLVIYVKSQLSQVEYLKLRITKLENQLDGYTSTILFQKAKEAGLEQELKTKVAELDSLKIGGKND